MTQKPDETDQQLLDEAETSPDDLQPVELDEVADAEGEMPPEEWGQDGVGDDAPEQEGGEN